MDGLDGWFSFFDGCGVEEPMDGWKMIRIMNMFRVAHTWTTRGYYYVENKTQRKVFFTLTTRGCDVFQARTLLPTARSIDPTKEHDIRAEAVE